MCRCEDVGTSADSDCECIRRSTRHNFGLIASNEVQLGIERLVSKVGDHHLVQGGTQHNKQVSHEVMGHRARGIDVFESERNCGRFGLTDEYRQHPSVVAGFLQQHNRRITGHLDSNTDQFHCDHEVHTIC